jgi:16S rRNA (uracil1498-N3)-methyltransferase
MPRDDYQRQIESHGPRFFVRDLVSDSITLPDDQGHHARNVMRLKAGATVELFDGNGGVASATLSEVSRGQVVAEVTERRAAIARPEPSIELAFAIPKGKRLDWLLEKTTELGAAILQPVVFERSVAGGDSLKGSKRDRWMTHCISAAKQCRTDFLPELRDPVTLEEYLGSQSHEFCLVGDVSADSRSIPATLETWTPGASIGVIVGPEGDFAPDEWAQLAPAGVRGVHLGNTILRVETAAVALIAAITSACDARH